MKYFLLAILIISSTYSYAEINSFSKAKKTLYTAVYKSEGYTIYTGCHWFISKGNKKIVDLNSCGLENAFPKKEMKRAKRIEAEHIIPASWFLKKNGNWRQCVMDAKKQYKKPRDYCQEHDPEYRQAHNDLINLFPSVGQINADRSNKPYSDSISGSNVKTFRGNAREITISSRVAIPPKEIRGDIARIAFFYRDKYGLKLNSRQELMFESWNKTDPISKNELIRNNIIKTVQGWGNPYLK